MLNFAKKTVFVIFVLTILKGSTAMAFDNRPFIIETDTFEISASPPYTYTPTPMFLLTPILGFECGRCGKCEECENEVFAIVEVSPEFPGGRDSLMKFIRSNIILRHGQGIPQGTVFVTFVVERDGSLTNIRILRGIDSFPERGADAQAIRIIESMPNWTPGKHQGRVVRTQFNLPIRFSFRDVGWE